MKILKTTLLTLFCFILVTLSIFLLVTFLMGTIKALQAVLYFYLIFGGCAGIWIIGSKIYEKLEEAKHGDKIIVILFFCSLIFRLRYSRFNQTIKKRPTLLEQDRAYNRETPGARNAILLYHELPDKSRRFL